MFLLINFWFIRIQANKAAIKDMIMDRIDDFSLIIEIIFIYYKSVDYATVAALTLFLKTDIINFLNLDINLLTIVEIFLFIGAVGKSAQLGLHTWLLYAMEGSIPVSLTYAWSFGFLAGMCLLTQMISGIFLAMHYTPHIDLAFSSVEYIMRDVPNGWFLRYVHANGASMFFIVVYSHIFRGLYYGSYIKPRELLWYSIFKLNLEIIFYLFLQTKEKTRKLCKR
jgi:hypothetical protein